MRLRIAWLLLAGLLYLGSGIGLACVTAAGRALGVMRPEAPLRARDLPWLSAIILFGGMLGPALLMFGLTLTSASSGALLLNTEGLATMAIAWVLSNSAITAPIIGASRPDQPCGRKAGTITE